MTPSIKNVSVTEFKGFLTRHRLKLIRISGGHEIWSGNKLTRPVVFQTHIDPVPLFIVKTNLRTMGLTMKDLRDYLQTKS